MTEYLPEFGYNPITYIFFIYGFCALVQLLYTSFIFGKLAFFKQRELTGSAPKKGVSIIIAARNESENLFRNLPFILEQDYPEFEVIVVNHQSMDDSEYILDAYTKQYKNLRIIKVERSQHLKYGKKLPLTIGIKGAKYEHMLFTDADCKPASNQWVKNMMQHFDDQKQIVLGYGPYVKSKSFLNKVIRFDTAWIAMSYISMAKAGIPYMGIGRNMAYTKTAFNSVGGFKSHYSLSSGDDDLFIQEAAKNKNYSINIDPESYCYSKTPKTWENWFKQKSRHYTTSGKYKVFKKLMLGIYPLTLLILLGSFVSLLFDSEFIWLSLVIFILLLLMKWLILGKAFAKLKESKFIALLPVLDIAYAILVPVMYYAIDKTDKNKW